MNMCTTCFEPVWG